MEHANECQRLLSYVKDGKILNMGEKYKTSLKKDQIHYFVCIIW